MGRVEYTKSELEELTCPDPEDQPNQVEKTEFKEGDRLPTDLVCDDTEKRIVGGQEAIKMSWPWMVQITYFGFPTCGGTIISDNAILTGNGWTFLFLYDISYIIDIMSNNLSFWQL